jgi:hypothetical protein
MAYPPYHCPYHYPLPLFYLFNLCPKSDEFAGFGESIERL